MGRIKIKEKSDYARITGITVQGFPHEGQKFTAFQSPKRPEAVVHCTGITGPLGKKAQGFLEAAEFNKYLRFKETAVPFRIALPALSCDGGAGGFQHRDAGFSRLPAGKGKHIEEVGRSIPVVCAFLKASQGLLPAALGDFFFRPDKVTLCNCSIAKKLFILPDLSILGIQCREGYRKNKTYKT